jgi:hypothetical protein
MHVCANVNVHARLKLIKAPTGPTWRCVYVCVRVCAHTYGDVFCFKMSKKNEYIYIYILIYVKVLSNVTEGEAWSRDQCGPDT